jgi:hypothetical protein
MGAVAPRFPLSRRFRGNDEKDCVTLVILLRTHETAFVPLR